MPRKSLGVKGYDADSIKALIRRDEKYLIGMRMYAVYLVAAGKSSRKVEDLYQTSFKQITNWVHRFEQFGVDGLKDKKGRGRKSVLTVDQLSILKEALKVSPTKNGFDALIWSGPLVNEFIHKSFHVTFKRAQVYKIIESLGYRFVKGMGFV